MTKQEHIEIEHMLEEIYDKNTNAFDRVYPITPSELKQILEQQKDQAPSL